MKIVTPYGTLIAVYISHLKQSKMLGNFGKRMLLELSISCKHGKNQNPLQEQLQTVLDQFMLRY